MEDIGLFYTKFGRILVKENCDLYKVQWPYIMSVIVILVLVYSFIIVMSVMLIFFWHIKKILNYSIITIS